MGTIIAPLDAAEHLLVGHGLGEESSHFATTFGCPLGSTYFCLGLHPPMLDMRRQFPTVRISAATDDIGLQGPIPDLQRAW
jgi:hypothetical protein